MEEQKKLFDIIKTKIGEQQRLADVVEELLDIRQDSAYRRIRCATQLSFSQLKILCERFNISVDELFNRNSSNSALFKYSQLVSDNRDDYANYLKINSETLKTLLWSDPDSLLLAIAHDIPFYHFFKTPDLALFRLFVWVDSLNHETGSFCKFSQNLDKNSIFSSYKRIYNTYLTTNSKEIWNVHTVDATLRLLNYYFGIGAFESKATALALLENFKTLVDTIKQAADRGYTDEKKLAFFEMYITDVDLGNNMIIAKQQDKLLTIIRLYSINRIFTDNQSLCFESEKWFNSLISKSILISGDAAFKERLLFFQKIEKKIKKMFKKIESL